MADNYQFKRGSTSANDAFVGPNGSISIDQEAGNVRIHDGVTPGGALRIQQAALINTSTLEFESNKESYVAIADQLSFTPSLVDLTIVEEVAVKVNGERQLSGWSVIGTNIVFDTALTSGDLVELSNIRTLLSIIQAATDAANIEQVVADAIETATGETDVSLGDLATKTALQEEVDAINLSLGGYATSQALQDATDAINLSLSNMSSSDDMQTAISTAISTASNIGGVPVSDIARLSEGFDCGVIN
jgi:hypothetical protein